jgi:hypothetical protein
MKQAKELANAIRNIGKVEDPVFVATVKAVDKNKDVVDVEYNDFELGEIRLQAVVKANSKGIKFYPVIDSVVIVQRLGNRGEFFITLYSEVEQVVMEVGSTKFDIKDGVLIKNGTETLKKILDDLIAEIQKITVPTNVGPSGVPINIAQFTTIKTRVSNLLK